MRITRREFHAALAGLRAPALPWNLLLVTCDQHRADCLGAAGNNVIRTPNLDRLAAEGLYFERNFVQCPQCVPSRSALHTGRYPHVNRTPSNLYRLPPTEQTLAMTLSRAGYLTACAGELPFAPTRFLGGFQKVVASDAEYHASLRAAGWRLEEHRERLKSRFQAWPVPWPEDLDETAFHAGRARQFIRENAGRPFFLHVNFRRPHHPFDPPAPFDRMYEGARFPASHRRDGEMKNKPPGQQKALEQSVGFDLRTMTAADLDRIKAYYYGMISENDKYIGRLLATLREGGIEDRTLVVVTSDHGEMLGDHGLLFKGGYFYDEVMRTPLIIRAPGKLPAGKRVAALVEEIDIMPTILELLGIAVPAGVQGQSLVGGAGRSTVHAEFSNIKMVRTAQWKLVHYLHAPYGELYNLREDPHELYNLWDDAAAAPARREMQARLADWLIDSQDPLLKPLAADNS